MIVTLTGTGTSHGIPVIGCNCPVCRSNDPHDMRFRCSVYVKSGNTALVIDTGPEFRLQAIKYNIAHLDAVLITHSHADHLNGLDDLRIFSHTASADKNNRTEKILNIYTNPPCAKDIRIRFDYIYKATQQGGGKPLLNIVDTEGFSRETPIIVRNEQAAQDANMQAAQDAHANVNTTGIQSTGAIATSASAPSAELLCIPVPMMHGSLPTTGWNIREKGAPSEKSFSYMTDCSAVPDESIKLIQGTEHLVIDGLREKPHATHFSFGQALESAAKICPKHVWLTHICHNNSHEQINAWLAEHKKQFPSLADIPVHAAYDGLTITI